ncbi:hypothetical protein [Dickeya dadantii]|uniref:hypothetical protein n=1 Tax=Dickeya dadantii TaxID=204038 RepID=UPI001CC7F02B|nr:hypothetical protein [Dickeya dadantii]UAY98062.1 hypothetical protein KTF62_09555 [Dickeya dadantii]
MDDFLPAPKQYPPLSVGFRWRGGQVRGGSQSDDAIISAEKRPSTIAAIALIIGVIVLFLSDRDWSTIW